MEIMSKKQISLSKIILFFLSALILVLASCRSVEVERVILGDEQEESYLPLLKDKRIALFSNHTGIVGDKIILSDGSLHYGGNDLYGKDDKFLSSKQLCFNPV